MEEISIIPNDDCIDYKDENLTGFSSLDHAKKFLKQTLFWIKKLHSRYCSIHQMPDAPLFYSEITDVSSGNETDIVDPRSFLSKWKRS